MRPIILITLMVSALYGSAQKNKVYLPGWTFHQKNCTIYGVSVGLWNFADSIKNTTTNGLRLSLIGEGILVPMVPSDPLPSNDSMYQFAKMEPVSERVNGISLSGSGIAGMYTINGISLGIIGHLTKRVNGISAAAMINFSLQHNGIQCALMMNECYQMNGLQIGFVNKSRRTRGIQIGIWNINEKRKFPLINWNFR